jgi:hypothetical protein
MTGTWEKEDDPTVVRAITEIYRGLKEGDRQIIAAGFERLGQAAGGPFWAFDSTWSAWCEEPRPLEDIVVTNPVTGEWLHFAPSRNAVYRARRQEELLGNPGTKTLYLQ